MRLTGTANSIGGYETELAEFFDGLGHKIDSTVKDYEAELASFFAGLGPVIDIAKRAQAELDRTAATKFSVFEYFKVPEEALSDIFGDLLNPEGSHGQGDIFLRLLLDETQLSEYSDLCLQECKVHLEYPTNKGRRVDIVVEIPYNRWLGIENKPWAVEGKNQVKHYLEYLQSKDANAWILYLSGSGSGPASLPVSSNKNCRTVPYRERDSESPSVENWVRQCLRKCQAERVRWFLKDLLAYIQRSF